MAVRMLEQDDFWTIVVKDPDDKLIAQFKVIADDPVMAIKRGHSSLSKWVKPVQIDDEPTLTVIGPGHCENEVLLGKVSEHGTVLEYPYIGPWMPIPSSFKELFY